MNKEPADVRLGNKPGELKQAILDNLYFIQGRSSELATPNDWYMATAFTVRDRMMKNWIDLLERLYNKDLKIVGYLSAEFLMGPHLGNALINLGIWDEIKEAVELLGLDLQQIMKQEGEPGLGNGGLGRLAACYLDSLTTLKVGAIGYGIRYEFGIFDQEIRDGWQVEVTDKWLQKGNAWEIVRPDVSFYVGFGGHIESETDAEGRLWVRWIPVNEVKGVACDMPMQGFLVSTCNTLRLWKSEAVESFDLKDFNAGDYYQAVQEKVISETLSKVLYPNDEPEAGKRLRLAQQYFFVSCSLQDMLRLLDLKGEPTQRFADMFAAQLNDTHPAIAVAELMRLLIDERQV